MLIDEPQTHQPLFHYSSLYTCAEPSHSQEPNARRKRLWPCGGRRPKSDLASGGLRRVFGSPLFTVFSKTYKTTSCRNILNELWQLSPLVLFVFRQIVHDTFRQVYADCITSINAINLFTDFHNW